MAAKGGVGPAGSPIKAAGHLEEPHMSTEPGPSTPKVDPTSVSAAENRIAWGERYFEIQHRSDPLNATLLGITDTDNLLGDVSVEGSQTALAEFTALADEIAGADRSGLDERATTDLAVLEWLVGSARSDATHCLWEAGASAAGYVSRQALVFQAIPATPIVDRTAALHWRQRLDAVPGYFDALLARYRDAADRGRTSPRCSVAPGHRPTGRAPAADRRRRTRC